jgi:hypothetical protein
MNTPKNEAEPLPEPAAFRITDGEGSYNYTDEYPEEFARSWASRYNRKHEPLFTTDHMLAFKQLGWNEGYKHGAWQDKNCAAQPVPDAKQREYDEQMLQRVAEQVQDRCASWEGIGARDVEMVLRLAALAQPVPDAPLCHCKDRPAADCPGEWEPGCDLGNNPAHVRVSAQPVPDAVPPVNYMTVQEIARSRGVDYNTLSACIRMYLREHGAAAHPQPAPLTVREVFELWDSAQAGKQAPFVSLARAVEARCGIVPAPTTGEGQ